MQIKITNEQPFQVLSTNFTISPSSSGYDLYFSADGLEYSKLFTVGANTNRQVTQVAAGSYYFLSGNTDTVTVNWMKNCGGSGSGGGSYVLPVASENTLGGVKIGSGLTMSGDTLNANPGGYTLPMASAAVLGGVKIGSGITIDANGVISAEGGSAAEAFKVNVSALISQDWTGEDYSALTEMVEYLSGKTEMVEAYIDVLLEDEPGVLGEAERYSLNYLDREQAIFFYLEGNYSYVLVLNFEDVEQSYTQYTELGGGGGGEDIYVINDIIAEQSSAATFYTLMKDAISGATAPGWDFKVFYRYKFFGMNDTLVPMQTAWINDYNSFGNENVTLVFRSCGYASACGSIPDQITVEIADDGSASENSCGGQELPGVTNITIHITSAGTFPNWDELFIFGEQDGAFINKVVAKCGEDNDVWGMAPIKYVYREFVGDDLIYHLCVEVPNGGTLYRGVWHWNNDDREHYTTDSWAAV